LVATLALLVFAVRSALDRERHARDRLVRSVLPSNGPTKYPPSVEAWLVRDSFVAQAEKRSPSIFASIDRVPGIPRDIDDEYPDVPDVVVAMVRSWPDAVWCLF